MASPREIFIEIEGITCEIANKGGPRRDLGEVVEGVRVVYDMFHYQHRLRSAPGEPLISTSTTQPVIGVEIARADKITRIPLAYSEHVKSLGEPLAARVLEYLQLVLERR